MTHTTIAPAPPAAPAWRREPYRVLFPLGVALAWAGVGHWLLHGLGALSDYRPVFHAIAQIQGFLTCFAVGFLFTAVPRRTGTAAPAAWQMAVAMAAPVLATAAAWSRQWWLSQACWLLTIVILLEFVVRRFMSARAARRPPLSFVWVPAGLLQGIAGSVLLGLFGYLGPEHYGLHEIGRRLLFQGMFLSLIIGIGGMVLPLVTRGEAPADATRSRRDLTALAGHLAAAAVLVASFWVELELDARTAFALRAILVTSLLVGTGGILRHPTLPGWHRRLVWVSAWMVPLGYALMALFPLRAMAGLHVVLIGGFSLMALSIGLHVTLAHGGRGEATTGRPWQVPFYGGALLAAALTRGLVDLDPSRFHSWLALSAVGFLLATVAWATLAWNRAPGETVPPEDPSSRTLARSSH